MSAQLPWTAEGGPPCCCVSGGVIPFSLCGAELAIPWCGQVGFLWHEPTSCPDKLFRKQVITFKGENTTVSTAHEQKYFMDTVTTTEWVYSADTGCTETTTSNGTSSSVVRYGTNPPVTLNSTLTDGVWSGDCGGYPCGGGYFPYPAFVILSNSSGERRHLYDHTSSLGEVHHELTLETTDLSDEVTPKEVLLANICAEVSCDPDTEEGCMPCCDDNSSFKKYNATGTCIVPGRDGLTFDASTCGSFQVSAQSSTLTLWFKDLEPDQTYQVTLTYYKQEFAKDKDGKYVDASCGAPASCAGEGELITDVITFTAGAWGEVLSDDCSRCNIAAFICYLNSEKPEGESVICTTGSVEMPIVPFHNVSFVSLDIEDAPAPE